MTIKFVVNSSNDAPATLLRLVRQSPDGSMEDIAVFSDPTGGGSIGDLDVSVAMDTSATAQSARISVGFTATAANAAPAPTLLTEDTAPVQRKTRQPRQPKVPKEGDSEKSTRVAKPKSMSTVAAYRETAPRVTAEPAQSPSGRDDLQPSNGAASSMSNEVPF